MFQRLVVVWLLIAPAAFAQISEKEARDQFKDGAKEATEVFKGVVKDATKTGTDAIKAFTKGIKNGGFENADIDALFDDLAAEHKTIRLAYDAALTAIATAGMDALVAFAGEADEDLQGVYPNAFHERDRSVVGKAKADLAKRAAKSASKISSALRKAAKTLDKDAGVGLGYLVRPVQPLIDVTFNQVEVTTNNFYSQQQVKVDLVFTRTNLVLAVGTATDNAKVAVGNLVSATSSPLPNFDADSRFRVGLQALPKGNYILSVFVDEDNDFFGNGDTVAITAR